jgi:hypothetical protein
MDNTIVFSPIKTIEVGGHLFAQGKDTKIDSKAYEVLQKNKEYIGYVKGKFLIERNNKEVSHLIEIESTNKNTEKKINALKEKHKKEIESLRKEHEKNISKLNSEFNSRTSNLRTDYQREKDQVQALKSQNKELTKSVQDLQIKLKQANN